RLEGSKGFTKDLCAKYHIPTGAYERFTSREKALAYVRHQGAPIVVKADGLAAGKGVTVAVTVKEAEDAVEALFGGAFGAAGAEAVIEEFLDGEEASFFAISDGEKAVAFGSAQDHKRVGERDTGPNTGGMGAYSPAPVVTPEIAARVMKDIIEPTVAAMKAEGCPFKGVLFAGLMIGKDGPKLIEFNTRFGDPECQVLMARLEDDLLGLLLACVDGRLPEKVNFSPKTALTVVLAAQGYPISPLKGGVIKGVEAAEKIPGVSVIHAGTVLEDGKLVANGGRVLNVVALADNVAEAQALAYRGVDAIDFPDGFCRRDIGWRAIKR
uniref:phosphoribosylamine--glycine ligase n=1 Tax=Rhodoblastus sp. TaxID=1962975 RepID=UPI0035ADFF2C